MEEQTVKWATIVAMSPELLYPPRGTAEEIARAVSAEAALRARHAELLASSDDVASTFAKIHSPDITGMACSGCGEDVSWPCRTWDVLNERCDDGH